MTKRGFKLFVFSLFFIFAYFSANSTLANSAPIESGNLVIPDIVDNSQKQTRDQKNEKFVQNAPIDPLYDKVISKSSRKISAIYPFDDYTLQNAYPGYRGANQLVIYTRSFGSSTGTNEFGKEAIVKDGVVVALTGANSNIPFGGYVISGHGSAKKWISDNLNIGTKIDIQDRTIIAYTTIDSFRYQAKEKINYVEDILTSTKFDSQTRNNKMIYAYLKKAKQQYKKSKKDNSDISLECAKNAIENASIAFRYTLPYRKEEFRGTWVRPNSKNITQIQNTLDEIKKAGIDNIFLETFWHGNTIYPSGVMYDYGFREQKQEFEGVDILSIWLKEAHKRNMKIHCWFESFYIGNKSPDLDPKSILSQKPQWMNRTRQKADFEGWVNHPQEHNGYFLDPANPEVTAFLLELIAEITAKYDVDGINVDYVRYPNIMKENKSNQWGYSEYARQEFMQIYDKDPVDLTSDDELWDVWCEYRKNKITSYVQKISMLLKDRDVVFSTVIFPDLKVSIKTKFQDWQKWSDEGYVNTFTPLILTSDDDITKSMLDEIKKKVSSCSTILPGLFAGFIESDPEDLLRQIHISRKLKLEGIILFDWAHLGEKYLEVLKTSVFRAPI